MRRFVLRMGIKILFFFLFATFIAGCAMTIKEKQYSQHSIEPPKEIQIPEKLPYKVSIKVNRDRELSYTQKTGDLTGNLTTIYQIGARLEDAVKYYFAPMFTGEEYKEILIDIDAVEMKVGAGVKIEKPGARGSQAVVRVKALIYIDGLIASLGIYAKGEDFTEKIVGGSGIAANLATVDAVKKLRREVYETLMFPGRAIPGIQEHIKKVPDDASAFVALSNLYRVTRNYSEAIPPAKRAIEIAPNSKAGYKLLGLIYKELNQYDEAVNYLKRTIEIDPKGKDVYLALSQVYNTRENYGEAINTLKKALEIAPKDGGIHYSLVTNYMAMGRLDEAIHSVNELIDLNTIGGIGTYFTFEEDYPVVVLVHGTVPSNPGGLEGGDRIIKINGQPTKGNRERFFQNLKGDEGTRVTLTIERKGIKEPFEKIVTIGKVFMRSAATPFGVRSVIYAVKGEAKESMRDAEKAYSLDPDNRWARRAISFASLMDSPPFTKGGKMAEALRILSTSKESFDRLLEALAYSKMGELRKSFEVYASIPEEYLSSKSVFRQHFKNAVLESLGPYLEDRKGRARSFEAKGQYREALKEYAELIRVVDEKGAREIRSHIGEMIKGRPYLVELSEEARRHALRAEVMTKEGKFEDAVREYREAIKIAPFFPGFYKAMALNYAELKEYRQAIRNLKIYLDLSPDAPDQRVAKDEIYKWEFMMERGAK